MHRSCGLAIVVLGACDGILGLNPTVAIDATFYDGRRNFACPPIGTTPSYDGQLHSVINQNCSQYTTSTATNSALALCVSPPPGLPFVAGGPIDGPLAAVPSLAMAWMISTIKLGADGDLAVEMYSNPSGGAIVFRALTRQPDGSWTAGQNVGAMGVPSFYNASAPTHGPNPHVLWNDEIDYTIHESVEDSTGAWSEPNPSGFSFPGISYPASFSLTDDGLRLVFVGSDANMVTSVYYTDRPALDQPFRTPVVLMGAPFAYDLFLTSDCGRIYMSGMQAIFFTQEQ
jgi:hypothetical protein